MLSNADLGVFTYSSTEPQNRALREICKQWDEEFWSYDQTISTLSARNTLILYAAIAASNSWSAALIADLTTEYADLLYIFVGPDSRQHGLGKQLLQSLIEQLKEKRIEKMLLEVRESNLAAKSLYEGFEMELIDRRKRYYSNGEDALIYQMVIRKING